jgi:hypothetical protein
MSPTLNPPTLILERPENDKVLVNLQTISYQDQLDHNHFGFKRGEVIILW